MWTRPAIVAMLVLVAACSTSDGSNSASDASTAPPASIAPSTLADSTTETTQPAQLSSEEQIEWMRDWWASLSNAEQNATCTALGDWPQDPTDPGNETGRDAWMQQHAESVLDGTVKADWPVFALQMTLNCNLT